MSLPKASFSWMVIARASPDVLFGNEGEASVLVGDLDASRLASLAPVVVVKQGALGCLVLTASGRSHVATRRLAVTDSTGAGDAFDAGFLYSLLASGYRAGGLMASEAVLRRAALAGHRAAARLLTGPRRELFV